MSPKPLNQRNLLIAALVGLLVLQLTGIVKIPNLLAKKPSNVKPHIIGGCAGTQYRCCPDNVTACVDESCSNC